MDHGTGAQRLARRLDALEATVRSLTRDEIVMFIATVRESTNGAHEWPPDRRFWFDGAAGLALSRDENRAIRELWTRMNEALVFATTGQQVDAWIDRAGLRGRPDRIGRRRNQIEGWAATILEREMGGDVWLAAIGIWNGLCAALLADRMSQSLRDDLAAS